MPQRAIRPWQLVRGAVVVMLVAAGCLSASAADESEQTDVSPEEHFTLRVLPLLREKCFGCHGDDPQDVQGALDVRSRSGLLKGGESEEPAIVPGDAEASVLYQAVLWEGYEMPPKENDRLTPEQTETIRAWIAAGAVWPSEAEQEVFRRKEWSRKVTADGVIVETSGGLSDDWTNRRYQPADLWAFQPLKKFPEGGPWNSAGHNPVDWFIQRRLAEAGVRQASQADPLTLIRRASFDLTGLPPAPEEIAEFSSQWQTDPESAWNRLIDRLLASPHYGERWGQHWLDVARYADTGGYSNDWERSNAWRYRDYVVRSFNNDKPYNQFVMEQLAGDELADASVRRRYGNDEDKVHETRLNGTYTSEESEWLIATGFLRMGPWDNAMVKSPEARQIYLDDVVNSVGQTFLSTTMRCLKCHDHKFDPLPTRDYYRLYASFAATQMAERKAPLLPEENQSSFASGEEHVRTLLEFATSEKNRLTKKREDAAREWYAARGREYVSNNARKDLPDEEKPPRHVGLDHVEQGQLKVREQDEWIWTRRLERYQPMVQSVYNGQDHEFKWDNARKLRINPKADPNWRPHSVILLGGALTAPGESVRPGVLSAIGLPVPGVELDDPYVVPEQMEGRRTSLARWITHPDNSLATRSIVNRVWQHHFGVGLAASSNNFGVKGAKPTHPELFDWLTQEFLDHGWRIKHLHRIIMQSRTYRMSSLHPDVDQLRNSDPDNKLLAMFPPRRLTAEEIRDACLAVTGELNPEMGGVPVMPEINMEVALQPRMIQFSLAPAWQPSPTRQERNRRSIYAYRVRGQANPFLELFNQPNPNDSCERRDSAAVTPQALTMFNSDTMTDRSIAFAVRLQKERNELESQIQRGFELALGRQPAGEELQRLAEYAAEMQEYHSGVSPESVEYPVEITRSLVEEFSGKPFSYKEILPAFRDYEADVKPADVAPETRALADVCLLLMNSNEFVYVY